VKIIVNCDFKTETRDNQIVNTPTFQYTERNGMVRYYISLRKPARVSGIGGSATRAERRAGWAPSFVAPRPS